MRNLYLIVLLAVLVGSVNAAPYWDPEEPGTTYQRWDFSTPDPFSTPEQVQNDYALGPILGEIRGTGFSPPPTWSPSGVWSGPAIEFKVPILPNTPNTDPQSYKEIYIEIGYIGSVQLARIEANGISMTPNNSDVIGDYQKDGKIWKIQLDFLRIEPNPTEEYICYGFNEFGPIQEIDYIAISTRCVPEPASLCLLALGGLALRRMRKRS